MRILITGAAGRIGSRLAPRLLDETPFFSGARFFLEPEVRQQQSFGNKAAVDCLLPCADGGSKLVLSCSETGRPFRMHITDTRDMVDGLMLALKPRTRSARPSVSAQRSLSTSKASLLPWLTERACR